MSAERHEIIQGGHARSKLRFEEFEHARHGHGACAVRDDDEDTLAIHRQRAQTLLRDVNNFLGEQVTVRESFSNDHWFPFSCACRVAAWGGLWSFARHNNFAWRRKQPLTRPASR